MKIVMMMMIRGLSGDLGKKSCQGGAGRHDQPTGQPSIHRDVVHAIEEQPLYTHRRYGPTLYNTQRCPQQCQPLNRNLGSAPQTQNFKREALPLLCQSAKNHNDVHRLTHHSLT